MLLSVIYYSMLLSWQIVASGGFFLKSFALTTPVLAGAWVILTVMCLGLILIKQWQPARYFLIIETILTAVLSQAVFKLIIYDNSPMLASNGVVICSLVLILHKFFFEEIKYLFIRIWRRIECQTKSTVWRSMRDIVAIVIVFLIVWIPDHERIIALSFVGEQLHHLDFFIMAPATSWIYGGKPYIDVISQYGVGVVGSITAFSQLLGGLSYVNVVGIIIGWVLMYYALTFVFLRRWLQSWLLALAAFIVLFRLQMCHFGVSPLVWLYPSSTPIRFGLDICWLWLLWQFLKDGRQLWLYLAAIYAGFAPFWMSATGMCVFLTFYVFLFFLMMSRQVRLFILITAGIIAPIACMASFLMFLGTHAFELTFWKRMVEYIQYFAHGHAGGVLPIYESIKYRHWWAFIMAMAMPLLYVYSLVFGYCQQVIHRRYNQEFMFVMIVAIYGLSQYQYFVVRSAVTSYYVAALPFVICCAWWVKYLVDQYAIKLRREIYAICLAVACYALITNHNYTAYPNLLNFSRNPLVDVTVAQHFPDRQGYFSHLVKNIPEKDKVELNNLGNRNERIVREEDFKTDQEVVEFYRREIDFSEDVALINKYVKPREPLAILSSFEAALLVQSKHPPFFYHTPMISSRPMHVRMFPTDAAHSPKFLAESIAQLELRKPSIVAMERIFLADKLPASYDDLPWGNISALVRYLRTHYHPVAYGKYLVIMERYNHESTF